MNEKIIYEWGLYDCVQDDHFNCSATPKEVAEYMNDPNVILRLQRWHPDEGMEDCHVRPNGTFERDGYFPLTGRKVPNRYVAQLERWVGKYGYKLKNKQEEFKTQT